MSAGHRTGNSQAQQEPLSKHGSRAPSIRRTSSCSISTRPCSTSKFKLQTTCNGDADEARQNHNQSLANRKPPPRTKSHNMAEQLKNMKNAVVGGQGGTANPRPLNPISSRPCQDTAANAAPDCRRPAGSLVQSRRDHGRELGHARPEWEEERRRCGFARAVRQRYVGCGGTGSVCVGLLMCLF